MTDTKQGLPEFKNPPKPPRQPRIARNLDSIRAGALKLELQDRVQLAKDLKVSIDNEVASLTAQAENAKKIAGGTGQ